MSTTTTLRRAIPATKIAARYHRLYPTEHGNPYAPTPAETIAAIRLRRRCAAAGHPLTEDHSHAGPESATEETRCRCGRNRFTHTYY